MATDVLAFLKVYYSSAYSRYQFPFLYYKAYAKVYGNRNHPCYDMNVSSRPSEFTYSYFSF